MKISHHHTYFTFCCHFFKKKRTCKALKQCYLLNLSGTEPHKLRWSHSAYVPDVLLFRALCRFFHSPHKNFLLLPTLIFANCFLQAFTTSPTRTKSVENMQVYNQIKRSAQAQRWTDDCVQLTLAQASSGILAEAAKRVAELRVCTGRCSIKWRAAGARWTLWPCPAAPDTNMRGRNTIGKLLLILSQNKTKTN